MEAIGGLEERAAKSQPCDGRKLILLAEDEPDIREMISMQIGRLGYDIVCAPDGRKALEIARAQGAKLNLLLSDMIMPGVSGTELADSIREFNPEIKVIFISGYSGGSEEDLTSTPGVWFLPKPFSFQELSITLKEALG